MNSWFVLRIFSQHLKLLGPMSLDALKEDLSSGKVAFSDFIYQPQEKRKWIRAFEIPELLAALPETPDEKEFLEIERNIAAMSKGVPAPTKPATPQKVVAESPSKKIDPNEAENVKKYGTDWYLQFEGSEFGPFAFAEVGKILRSGEFKGSVLAWQSRLPTWIKVNTFDELITSVATSIEEAGDPIIERGVNLRASPREVLIASVSVQTKGRPIVGVCKDISEGGLKVFRLDAELDEGKTYSLTIVPITLSAIPPFTVHARLMWHNKTSKYMGFQFIDELEIQTVAMNLRRASNTHMKY